MVDEDFVMGYCVGYNDGVGSGGSGGVPGDMNFAKKYQLVGTDWSVGLNADYYGAEESLTVYSTSGGVALSSDSFAPYPLETNCEILFVVLKNNFFIDIVKLFLIIFSILLLIYFFIRNFTLSIILLY